MAWVCRHAWPRQIELQKRRRQGPLCSIAAPQASQGAFSSLESVERSLCKFFGAILAYVSSQEKHFGTPHDNNPVLGLRSPFRT